MSGWTKSGLVLETADRSHAMLPTPYRTDDRLLVYFAACDADMRGRIYAVDLADDGQVRGKARLVLDLGDPGEFDCDGVNPCQVIARGDEVFLYYIGWQRGPAAVPYRLFVGLAASRDRGATFRKVSRDPILPPLPGEDYFRTAAHVYPTPSGWAALYIGGGTFIDGRDGKRLPVYSLRRTASRDGVTWIEPGEVLLSPDRAQGEIGFGRPWLWHGENGEPVLLLSVRTEQGYSLVEIGFDDGQLLRRRTLIEPGAAGWDSEMVCFAAPIAGRDRELLFYNGNGYGRTGFGIAQRPSVVGATRSPDRLIAALQDLARVA